MAIDGVPLWIGGGEANHSAELLRMLNYVVFTGQEGFMNPTECRPLDTPGEGVQILPAPFVINSKFPGGALQSYMDRIYSAEIVPTTPVPPGSVRHDLVVINVEDPYPSGGVQWPFPGEVGTDARRTGPYVHGRVIEGVPLDTYSVAGLPESFEQRGWTAIPVARLDRPPNTGTVTADMIKPLISVVNPWQGVVLPDEILNNISQIDNAITDLGDIVQGIINQELPIPDNFVDSVQCTDSSGTLNWTEHSFKTWPSDASWQMLVPPWATHAEFFCIISGPYQRATSSAPAHVWGETRLQIGNSYSSPCIFDMDELGDTFTDVNRWGNRPPIVSSGQVRISGVDRCQRVNMRHQARQYDDSSGNTKGKLVADRGTRVYVSVKFKGSA